MRRTILIIISIALTTLFFSLIYLSTYGVKTDNFNTFINTKVKEYNSKLNLKLDAVFIKLNLLQGSININTKDAILIAENNEIKILNTDINLNISQFIKKENSIKEIKKNYDNINKELKAFSNELNQKEQWVVISKVDKISEEKIKSIKKEAKKLFSKKNVFYVSSISGAGLESLIQSIGNRLASEKN